jgi:hypothetical protein
MTPEQVRDIAENAADKAAEKAVRATLIALGVNPDKLHEEQTGVGIRPHHAAGHQTRRPGALHRIPHRIGHGDRRIGVASVLQQTAPLKQAA